MFVVLLAAACTWLFLRGLIPQLRRGLLDQPNARSSHSQPTPRGGGLAFVAVASICSFLALLGGHEFDACGFPLLAVPLAVVGLIDDRRNLSALWRYGVQLLTAIGILSICPLIQTEVLDVEFGSWLLPPLIIVLVIAITALINFTNFMDGLDGLVAGCMSVAFSVTIVVLGLSWPMWALVGSLLGFLLWNWSPAKVFMGDAGSTFLGAVFAGLVLQATSWQEAFGLLLVATPLLGDACLCVLRRWLVGQHVFQAHRLHLFQRLHQVGWPHSRVSLTYIAATALLALAMLVGGLSWVFALAVVELLFGVWLDQRVAVPFAVASKS